MLMDRCLHCKNPIWQLKPNANTWVHTHSSNVGCTGTHKPAMPANGVAFVTHEEPVVATHPDVIATTDPNDPLRQCTACGRYPTCDVTCPGFLQCAAYHPTGCVAVIQEHVP
jgi:hypothetical protein